MKLDKDGIERPLEISRDLQTTSANKVEIPFNHTEKVDEDYSIELKGLLADYHLS